jgi:hypothetical protein
LSQPWPNKKSVVWSDIREYELSTLNFNSRILWLWLPSQYLSLHLSGFYMIIISSSNIHND